MLGAVNVEMIIQNTVKTQMKFSLCAAVQIYADESYIADFHGTFRYTDNSVHSPSPSHSLSYAQLVEQFAVRLPAVAHQFPLFLVVACTAFTFTFKSIKLFIMILNSQFSILHHNSFWCARGKNGLFSFGGHCVCGGFVFFCSFSLFHSRSFKTKTV